MPTDHAVALCTDGAVIAAGPSLLDGEHIRLARSDHSGDQPFVQITLDEAGAQIFAAATGRLAALPPPENELAIALDARVVSAPTVQQAITGGEIQVAGPFTAAQVDELARDLELAAVLPVDLV